MNTETTITVTIPTMWRSIDLHRQLVAYINNEIVDQIIIIDNDVDNRPVYMHQILNEHSDKVIVYPQEENIGVNPAWNLGIVKSKNDIVCIANDDIVFDPSIFEFVIENQNELGIFGFDYTSHNYDYPQHKLKLVDPVKERYIGNHWGCLLFLRKSEHYPIPRELMVWYGANWIAENNRGRTYALNIKGGLWTEKHATSKDFNHLKLEERNIFNEKIKTYYKDKEKIRGNFINKGQKEYNIEYLSKGATRFVYKTNIKRWDYVVKELNYNQKNKHVNNNRIEWDFYYNFGLTPEEKEWLLKPHDISVCGRYIVFRKIDTFTLNEFSKYSSYIRENLPLKIKNNIKDCYSYNNWGLLNGKPVMIDYGFYGLNRIMKGNYDIPVGELTPKKNRIDKYHYSSMIDKKLRAKRNAEEKARERTGRN